MPLLLTRHHLILPLLLLLAACQHDPTVVPEPVDESIAAGGATTVYATGSQAYSLPAANLLGAHSQQHRDGDQSFGQRFVTGGAGTLGGGLGPLFITASCTGCHVSDGRGPRPATPADAPSGLLLRLSLPGITAQGAPVPVPGFGDQLQTRAVSGVLPEGLVSVQYQEQLRHFADGLAYQLRQPEYRIDQPYMPLPTGVLVSARVPPPVFGLGLLEAVSDADLVALADENDRDGDGISGRPNYVWDVAAKQTRLGRFGWKANQPSLHQQNAAAYNGDMGVTTPLFPLKSAMGQLQGVGLPAPGTAAPDVDASTLTGTTFYLQTLGVPARRNTQDALVRAGQVLFAQAKCASCHVPRLRTATLPGLPAEVADQTIFPYTDLLLHDMGAGLADGRPDFRATGNEWRTPPLWGLGLSEVVNGHQSLLHDGRARGIMEAILWHGGEAAPAAAAVERMSANDRAALLAFVQSL